MDTTIPNKFTDDALDMKVVVTSFTYSMQFKPSVRASLSLHGTVNRPGILCKFALQGRRGGGHTLEFKEATIFDGTEPHAVARSVKQTLLDFVDSHPDIPASFRAPLRLCILNHHLQQKRG